jgi:hypothetical protein
MKNDQIFHVYKKNTKTTEVVHHSLTLDEMENMIAERKVDWHNWEIQPCCTEYDGNEASY